MKHLSFNRICQLPLTLSQRIFSFVYAKPSLSGLFRPSIFTKDTFVRQTPKRLQVERRAVLDAARAVRHELDRHLGASIRRPQTRSHKVAAAKTQVPENFVQTRLDHLNVAIELLQSKNIDEHAALERTIQSLHLNSKQALQLEDALARYLIHADVRRAVDESPDAQLTNEQNATAIANVDYITAVAARALSYSSSTQSAGLKAAPSGALSTAAVKPLPESGATPSRQIFASTSQFAPKWAQQGGPTACAFIAPNMLDAALKGPEGAVTTEDLDVAIEQGVQARLNFTHQTNAPLDTIPPSESILARRGFSLQPLPNLPIGPAGQIFTPSDTQAVVAGILNTGKSSIVVAGSYAIAVARAGSSITVLDSHGDVQAFTDGPARAYAVSFSDARQAALFLTTKLQGFVAGFNNPHASAFEIYQQPEV